VTAADVVSTPQPRGGAGYPAIRRNTVIRHARLPRASGSCDADAAPGPREALPWLRRLCLLDYEVLAPELREHLTRGLTAPDLVVRTATLAAAMGLTREHILWALELVATAETNTTLRTMYRRTIKAERAELGMPPVKAGAGRKTAAKARPRKRS
jgi:hypothetical protein